jgi:Zn-dependent peptidase ImmA (M78 family)
MLEDNTTIDSADLSEDEFANKDPFEAEADIFAGELLVPLAMLKRHYQPGFTSADIARIFDVSEAAASVALLNHFSALFKQSV